MSLCFTEKPTDPSRAFVYSLLGDGEPHLLTGVGGPLNLDIDDDFGLQTTEVQKHNTLAKEPKIESPTELDSVKLAEPNKTDELKLNSAIHQDELTPRCEPIEHERVERECSVSPNDVEKEIEKREPEHPDARTVTLDVNATQECDIVSDPKMDLSDVPPTHMTKDILESGDGLDVSLPGSVITVTSSNTDTSSEVESMTICEDFSSEPIPIAEKDQISPTQTDNLGNEFNKVHENQETEDTSTSIVTSVPSTIGVLLCDESDSTSLKSNEIQAPADHPTLEIEAQTTESMPSTMSQIEIEIPVDSLGVSSASVLGSLEDNVLQDPTIPNSKHDTSSDSSEQFVTAANSEAYESAPSTSEDLCFDDDPRSWSPEIEPLPDMQPDSLESMSIESKEFPAADRSLPVFILEEGPPSFSTRAPKKLFREEDEVETESPDVNLKDLEDRKLREFERERRRIIDNQCVRRKKIDYWAFVSEDKQQTADVNLAVGQQAGTIKKSPGTTTPPAISPNELCTPTENTSPLTSPPGNTENSSDGHPITSLPAKTNTQILTDLPTHPTTPPLDNQSDLVSEMSSYNSGTAGSELGYTTPPASPKNTSSRIPMFLGRVSPGALPKGWSASPPVIRSVSPPVSRVDSSSTFGYTKSHSQSPSPLTLSSLSPPLSPVGFSGSTLVLNSITPPSSPSEFFPDCTSQTTLLKSELAGDDEDHGPRVLSPILKEPAVAAYNWKVSGFQTNLKQPEQCLVRSSSPPQPGSVDCASILENKERLRLFWETRIMAEQENAVAAGASEPAEAEEIVEVSPPDSLNEESHTTESIESFSDATGDALPAEESAIDLEVRLALTRELQLKQEQAERQQLNSEAPEVPKEASTTGDVQAVATEPQLLVDVNGHGATIQSEAPVVEGVLVKDVEVVVTELEVKLVTEEEQVESSVDSEPQEEQSVAVGDLLVMEEPGKSEPLETNAEDAIESKPQIVGETYHIANGSSPQIPDSPPPVVVLSPQLSPSLPAALPTPKADRPPFNPGADSKIAQEIQEMKAREEELRIMRESLNQPQNGTKSPSVSSLLSEGGSVHSDEGHGPTNGRTSPSPLEEKQNGFVNGHHPHGMDSLQGQTVYNIGYAFGHRRKDGVKVKPLADQQEETSPVETFQVLKESPIEREIRLSREREEELRKEKSIGLPESEEPTSLQRPSTLTLNGGRQCRGAITGVIKPAPVSDTQRFLATNRIQQEIEEQTEREKALRASGKIQTISQERTDSKVTRLRDVSTPAEKKALLLASSPPTSPVLSSSASDSDKSSPGINGLSNGLNGLNSNGLNGLNSNGLNGLNGHHQNGSNKTPSPSNSTVSGGPIKVGAVAAGRRFSNPPPGRGVSMQRFIASKGKELSFSTFNSKNKEKSSSVLSLHSYNGNDTFYKSPVSPVDGRAVSVVAPASVQGVPKRCVPAETKIQEELKEMQAREAELKLQRARLIGLSQPNLSTLETDEDLQVSNGHHHQQQAHHQINNNGLNGMERASSNPNLLDDDQYDEEEDNEKISVGGPRRRSMLIDQWEKRIQKKDVVKA